MTLRIGPARARDAGAVLALHLASWRDAYGGMLDPAFLAGPVEEVLGARWRQVFATRRHPGAVLLARRDGEAVGFVAAWLRGEDCYVDNLHVRPGLRGGGVGRALLGEAAMRLAAAGARSASLGVFAANQGALRFYAALGGEVGPEVMGETFGQAVPEHEVRWPAIEVLIRACAAPASA
jgi:ribosomal protein S18 acetylase RimI-like enzyme